jgi:hypothetical protein
MLSSISNFEATSQKQTLDRFTVMLLAVVLLTLVSFEVVTRIGFDRISKVQVREMGQRQVLVQIRDSTDIDDPSVAILGNSLMLDGTDVRRMKEEMQPRYATVPYFVLGTEYYDWYYGLKRLFGEGMRPRYVVLGLSPNQLTSTYIRGDYSARYLFRAADLPAVARQTHMDLTTASGFILAHFSEAYGTRDVIRGFLMGRLLPNVEELLHNRLNKIQPPELDQRKLRILASERLLALHQLCRENGARFLLVIPPTSQKGEQIIQEVGAEKGIPVIVSVREGEFDAGDYQADGFHLNEKGSVIFTERLSKDLLSILPQLSN